MKLSSAPILIYLVVPALGLCIYIWLCRQMRISETEPPYLPLFILFNAYGGWLIFLLTVAFWELSGIIYLLVILLVTIVPIVMLIMIIYLFSERGKSIYHYSSFVASIAYIAFFIILIAGMAIFVW